MNNQKGKPVFYHDNTFLNKREEDTEGLVPAAAWDWWINLSENKRQSYSSAITRPEIDSIWIQEVVLPWWASLGDIKKATRFLKLLDINPQGRKLDHIVEGEIVTLYLQEHKASIQRDKNYH